MLPAAYRMSKTQDNKDRILVALQRAFKGLVPAGGSPEEFIARCETWYNENRARSSLNMEYAFNLHLHYGDEVPLFVLNEAESEKTKTVLAAVKRHYLDRGWAAPERVVIVTRGNDAWLVHAGPENNEAALEIDPNTGRVLHFLSGE